MKRRILSLLAGATLALQTPPVLSNDLLALDPNIRKQSGRAAGSDFSKFRKPKFVIPHADLVIEPYFPGSGPAPQSGFCDVSNGKSVLRFYVHNKGAKHVLNTRIEVDWGPYGTTVRPINPVGAGGRVHVRVPLPDAVPPTFTIPFVVSADHLKQVFEISETNNSRSGTCTNVQSPGGGGS